MKHSVQSPTGIVMPQTITLPVSNFLLESGYKLPEVHIQYETYGSLNADKSNAILILHAFSGDAHAAGLHKADDKHAGWWDNLIRPQGGFDTNRFYVICTNTLGGCMGTTGPGSINPKTGKAWGMLFPTITIGDMVNVQREFLQQIGISKLYAVAGGSMGGMQALEWAIRYPEMVERAVVLASTARLNAQGIAFNAVGRNAIMSDPHWNDGNYYDRSQPDRGLAIARMIGHITYLSAESMRIKFGRKIQKPNANNVSSADIFAVESYLAYQGEKFVDRFDANSYIYLSKAMDSFDLIDAYGGLDAAAQRTQSSFLMLTYSSDWLFPTEQTKEIVYALIKADKNVSFNEINSPYGHDSFLIETEVQTKLINAFLQGTQ